MLSPDGIEMKDLSDLLEPDKTPELSDLPSETIPKKTDLTESSPDSPLLKSAESTDKIQEKKNFSFIEKKNDDDKTIIYKIKDDFNSMEKTFNSMEKTENSNEIKNIKNILDSWFDNDGKLIGTTDKFNLYVKNKNISLDDIDLKDYKDDKDFKKITSNNNYPKEGAPYNKTNTYSKCINASDFINQTLVQIIVQEEIKENSLVLEDIFTLNSDGKKDGYSVYEGISIDTTLANLDLDKIKIVYDAQQINNNDVKCFFILKQIVDTFNTLNKYDFNHGKLTAHNIIVDIDDEKYIKPTDPSDKIVKGLTNKDETNEDKPGKDKIGGGEEDLRGGGENIETNFRIKIYNFSKSSITYEKIRIFPKFEKKLGILEDKFEDEDYKEINKFYRQLLNANPQGAKIKNTFKNSKTFKKILRHSPVPFPFAFEFYILIMSIMLCNTNNENYFFDFFRMFYFDSLFDYNLMYDVLDEAEKNENKIVKSCISYKMYELIRKKQNNENSIDLPFELLSNIPLKLNILDLFDKKTSDYINTIKGFILNTNNSLGNVESLGNVQIEIDNIMKSMSEIDNDRQKIDEREIPNKLIVYVEPSIKDKELLRHYDKKYIFNFSTKVKYEEDKMNDVTANFFKDKSSFNVLLNRFDKFNTSTANVYKAELSKDNNLGIVDNNIMLTIKKSFPINGKVKLNNGKVYTIIDAKWEPGKWVKQIPDEIDKIEKIKKKFEKNIKLYDIPKNITIEDYKYNINLDMRPYTPEKTNRYDINQIKDLTEMENKRNERIKRTLQDFNSKIGEILKEAKEKMKRTEEKMGTIRKKVMEAMGEIKIGEEAKKRIQKILKWTEEKMKQAEGKMGTIREEVMKAIGNIGIGEEAKKRIGQILEGANGKMRTIGEEVMKAIREIEIGEGAKEIIGQILEGAEEKMRAIREEVMKSIGKIKIGEKATSLISSIAENIGKIKNIKWEKKINYVNINISSKNFADYFNDIQPMNILFEGKTADYEIKMRDNYILKIVNYNGTLENLNINKIDPKTLLDYFFIFFGHSNLTKSINIFPLNEQFTLLNTNNETLFTNNEITKNDASYYIDFNHLLNFINDVNDVNTKKKIEEILGKNYDELNPDSQQYSDKLIDKYNKIILLDNKEYKITLMQELFLLKSCCVYYYLFEKTKKEMEEENGKIDSNNPSEISDKVLKISNDDVGKSCLKLYYLTYLYYFRELMYNYYLYNFYLWIENTIEKINNKMNLTREKIMSTSDSTIIDQNKYDLIIKQKEKLFTNTSKLILEFQNFYDNNKDVVSFTKNKLMNILRHNNYKDYPGIEDKLLKNLNDKISNDINDENTSDGKQFTIEEINPRNKYTLINCIEKTMKNKYTIENVPYYNKSIIEEINNGTDLENLKRQIIEGFQYKISKLETDDMENKQNVYFDEDMMKILSEMLNCSFFIYYNKNGKRLSKSNSVYAHTKYIRPDLKLRIGTREKVYNIILKETINDSSTLCYDLIKYNGKGIMTCDELPPELQLFKYCYNEKEASESIGGGLNLTGGSNISKEINVISKNIDDTDKEIAKNKERILIGKRKLEKTEQLGSNYNTEILKEIKTLENDNIENRNKLIQYHKDIIQKYDTLIKDEKPVDLNQRIRQRDIYIQKLKNLKVEKIQEEEKNKKVYGVVVKLILFPGENPNIIEKQKYKCKNSFEELKNEYCQVFGIGCSDKNKKTGGTIKSRIIKNRKRTLKKYIFK